MSEDSASTGPEIKGSRSLEVPAVVFALVRRGLVNSPASGFYLSPSAVVPGDPLAGSNRSGVGVYRRKSETRAVAIRINPNQREKSFEKVGNVVDIIISIL